MFQIIKPHYASLCVVLFQGTPSLYVDHQEITAFERGSVTVMCHYKYPKVTEWCRLNSTCVTDQAGSIDGTTVTINASVPNVFTVTMSELKTESSGWYWCANGGLQMPVHITVHELTSTITTTMSPSTASKILIFYFQKLKPVSGHNNGNTSQTLK